MFSGRWVWVSLVGLLFILQKYISTVQKSVNSTEQQRASDAAKNKKMASKEVRYHSLQKVHLACRQIMGFFQGYVL